LTPHQRHERGNLAHEGVPRTAHLTQEGVPLARVSLRGVLGRRGLEKLLL
jgi:hypothetical protein